jgi:hypothetical protein
MFETLTVYIGLAFFMAAFFRLAAKSDRVKGNKKNGEGFILFMIAILAFTAVFGMRYYVGIDYDGYYTVYNSNDTYSLMRYEPGFKAITSFCMQNELHYALYFTILAFIQAIFSFGAFRKNKEMLPFYVCIVIFTGLAMTGWMNGIRQSLAMAIYMFALSFLCRRNLKSVIIFYVFLALAVMFHYTALLYVITPLYLLFRKGMFKNRKVQLFLLFAMFVLQLFNIKSLITGNLETILKYTIYAGDYDSVLQKTVSGGYGIFDMLLLAIYALMIYHGDGMKKFFNNDEFFTLIYDFGILGIYLEYFFGGSMMLQRVVQYVIWCKYPLMAYLMLYFYKQGYYSKALKQRYVVMVIFVFLSFARIMGNINGNTTRFAFYFQEELRHQKEVDFNNAIGNVN